MTRFSAQRSPNIRVASSTAISRLADLLAQAELERGSERHPGCPALQDAWDTYLDAVALAAASGEDEDAIIAGRLYLAWKTKRDAQGASHG